MELVAKYLLKVGFELDSPKFLRRYLQIEEPKLGKLSLTEENLKSIVERLLADPDETLELYEWLVRRYDQDLCSIRKPDFRKVGHFD